MTPSKTKRGSILAEALVAVTTLIAGVVAVSTIINNAVSATAISRDYLVAENLANEAIESVKIIRDTNLMMWPQYATQCWLVAYPSDPLLNPGADGSGCAAKLIVNNTNYLSMENGGKWKLAVSAAGGDLNLSGIVNAQAPYRLYLKTFNPGPSQYVKYVHIAGNPVSKFYRSVKTTDIQAGSAAFEVKVQWLDGTQVREIKRNYTIYNYL